MAAGSSADADFVVTEEKPGRKEDIITLILEEHARIRHLVGALGEAERGPGRRQCGGTRRPAPDAPAGGGRDLLLPFVKDAAGGGPSIRDLRRHKDDICDAVADTRLREAGSAQWRPAVRAARADTSTA